MTELEIVRGSIEFLYADIRTDTVLDTQAVYMSVSPQTSPSTWVPATWVGRAGTFRSCRILLDGTLLPDLYTVFARITDEPEAPIIRVGRLKIV